MAAITDPLALATIVFFLGAAANRLAQPEGHDADGMVFRFMLGPACLAVIILILSGTADHLYLLR